MRDINWAVLGTGVIANEMAVALKKNGKNIYAVGNRTYEKAVAFGEKYGIGKVYTDYNEMFTDRDVDVIYITTPHNTHKKFMKQAIENGKHILVEKSITLNSDELNEMAELADKNHVIIGEAMTIYHMPIYKKLKEILETGVLGKVNLITMNFGSFKEYDMNNRFFNRNLAGGAMLDIGVYALSFIRWFMDSKPDNFWKIHRSSISDLQSFYHLFRCCKLPQNQETVYFLPDISPPASTPAHHVLTASVLLLHRSGIPDQYQSHENDRGSQKDRSCGWL